MAGRRPVLPPVYGWWVGVWGGGIGKWLRGWKIKSWVRCDRCRENGAGGSRGSAWKEQYCDRRIGRVGGRGQPLEFVDLIRLGRDHERKNQGKSNESGSTASGGPSLLGPRVAWLGTSLARPGAALEGQGRGPGSLCDFSGSFLIPRSFGGPISAVCLLERQDDDGVHARVEPRRAGGS